MSKRCWRIGSDCGFSWRREVGEVSRWIHGGRGINKTNQQEVTEQNIAVNTTSIATYTTTKTPPPPPQKPAFPLQRQPKTRLSHGHIHRRVLVEIQRHSYTNAASAIHPPQSTAQSQRDDLLVGNDENALRSGVMYCFSPPGLVTNFSCPASPGALHTFGRAATERSIFTRQTRPTSRPRRSRGAEPKTRYRSSGRVRSTAVLRVSVGCIARGESWGDSRVRESHRIEVRVLPPGQCVKSRVS